MNTASSNFSSTEECWAFLLSKGTIVDCSNRHYKTYVRIINGDPYGCIPNLHRLNSWSPFPGPDTYFLWRPYDEAIDDKLPHA